MLRASSLTDLVGSRSVKLELINLLFAYRRHPFSNQKQFGSGQFLAVSTEVSF
jgi:hypothetical protein